MTSLAMTPVPVPQPMPQPIPMLQPGPRMARETDGVHFISHSRPARAPSPYEVIWNPAGTDPRVGFHDKFQQKMEEHDRDFEKKYNGDLDTTLIFSGLFSAVTSAFIIDVQSELTPDYEQMNNTLLEMLLNATTGSLPAGPSTPLPRWSGPDPVIVQVQCILYAALSAALLASFLAMLGKQWINRYGQNETHGSATDRSRVRERKLNGIETWKFHLVMESLPLILQFALLLLGFALSRYLWGANRSVSSVVVGFTSFGFLFYLSIVTASIFSFDCPFQTPFSLAVRFLIRLAVPYWLNVRHTFGPKQQPPQSGTPRVRYDLPFSVNTIDRGDDLEANTTATPCMAPDLILFPRTVAPLFIQKAEAEGDRLDSRCITRVFVMSTDPNVVSSTMDFIPEIIWHSGIKDVPLKRIYGILVDCLNFSGPSPVVTPGLRNMAYLSAKAFTHIALQRRCIAQYEEHKQDSWKALCVSHPLLSLADYDEDDDLEAALFMVDMTLGYDNGFPWEQTRMTKGHHEWMSHVFLYHVWHEGQLSKVVVDFVESSMSLRWSSDIVITDCLFIIGLMIGVPFHVSDITVKDKSRKKRSMIKRVFNALSAIFSSKSTQSLSPLPALRLVTQLAFSDTCVASYKLFKTIMGSSGLTDQHWEAARLAIRGAFQQNAEEVSPQAGEPKEILKFLGYHLGLQGAGEDHRASIAFSLVGIPIGLYDDRVDPLTVEYIRELDCTSPSFVGGMRSIMHPDNSLILRLDAVGLLALISDQWFNSPLPVMEPEEMSEFCGHFAMVLDSSVLLPNTPRNSYKHVITVLFGMLRSLEWRKHIGTEQWHVFSLCGQAKEEDESFRCCLQNATELLEFTRGLPDGEGLKWWCVTLWLHYDKLDTTVRDEVERIASDVSRGDGTSDPNSYLNLIKQEVTKIQELGRRWGEYVVVSGDSESDVEPGGSEVSLRRRR